MMLSFPDKSSCCETVFLLSVHGALHSNPPIDFFAYLYYELQPKLLSPPQNILRSKFIETHIMETMFYFVVFFTQGGRLVMTVSLCIRSGFLSAGVNPES